MELVRRLSLAAAPTLKLAPALLRQCEGKLNGIRVCVASPLAIYSVHGFYRYGINVFPDKPALPARVISFGSKKKALRFPKGSIKNNMFFT